MLNQAPIQQEQQDFLCKIRLSPPPPVRRPARQCSIPLSGRRRYICFISVVAALGGFLFGFDSGVINGTVTALSKAFNSDSVATGFNVASVLLGCAVGALCAGPAADRFGRKPVMLLTALVFAISAWGSGAADSATAFILYRVLGGLGIGAASVLAPAYISEVAPAAWRGRLATLQQLAIVLGLFVAFLSNYLIANAAGSAEAPFWLELPAWRWMFWMELVPSVLFLLGVLLIPESPRYLVASGQLYQASAVFQRIAPGDADAQVLAVRQSLQGEHKPRLRDLVSAGSGWLGLRPVVWVGIGLSCSSNLLASTWYFITARSCGKPLVLTSRNRY